ncbi:hypothetical protein ABZS29_07695 [Kribbella sp. NPDC005582]|uniref:hypothetical protein n=1 Tax=Kribbella sp. NPDC005582 TaxID=3156893 RepID=UPI0033A25439
MKKSTVDYLRLRRGAGEERSRPDLDAWPDIAGDFDDVLHDAWITAARRIDPMASLEAFLEVRLSGDRFENGEIDVDQAASLFPVLSREVEAASTTPERSRLALAGVAVGSVILVLKPTSQSAQESGEQLEVANEAEVDPAVRKVMDLHRQFGIATVTPAAISSGFQRPLLDAAAKLIYMLTDWQAELAMTWHPSHGRPVRSQLDHHAQSRALSFFDQSRQTERATLHGQVVEMSLAGHFVIKPSIKGAQKKVHVSTERLRTLDLKLGETITVVAERSLDIDRVGREAKERFEFIQLGDAPAADDLPLD